MQEAGLTDEVDLWAVVLHDPRKPVSVHGVLHLINQRRVAEGAQSTSRGEPCGVMRVMCGWLWCPCSPLVQVLDEAEARRVDGALHHADGFVLSRVRGEHGDEQRKTMRAAGRPSEFGLTVSVACASSMVSST